MEWRQIIVLAEALHIELEELKKSDLIAYEGNGPYLLFGRELSLLFDIIFMEIRSLKGARF